MKKYIYIFLSVVLLTSLQYKSYGQNQASGWKYFSAGAVTAYAIDSEGYLWSWGHNGIGQVMEEETPDGLVLVPTKIGDSKWIMVQGSGGWAAGIKEDGTLWGWGDNSCGQLGKNPQEMASTRAPVQIAPGNDWVKLHVGKGNNLFGYKADGTIWVCGKNLFGELGLGESNKGFIFPMREYGNETEWKAIAGSGSHSLGLKQDGTIWATGNNENGRIGVDNDFMHMTYNWMQIGQLNDWADVAVGMDYSLALKEDGTLWAWGLGGFGNLGQGNGLGSTYIGTYPDKWAPYQVGTDSDWAKVCGTTEFTLALKEDGTLWFFGGSAVAFCEDALGDYIISPIKIGSDNDWEDVTSMYSFVIGKKKNKGLYIWGMNQFGQLGTGNTDTAPNPIPAPILVNP